LSRAFISISSILEEYIIEAAQLRRFLSANIKDRRKKLGISQEKLAELANMSVQTINCIEGCRTWVSDKTLVKLAEVLGVEVFQLLGPVLDDSNREKLWGETLRIQLLDTLQQDIKDDIDCRFKDFIRRPHSA
jgi:transcriptional regulator with XRE-family HTH domain